MPTLLLTSSLVLHRCLLSCALQKEYSTTTGLAFKTPSTAARQSTRPRFGMVTEDTLNEAAWSYGQPSQAVLKVPEEPKFAK